MVSRDCVTLDLYSHRIAPRLQALTDHRQKCDAKAPRKVDVSGVQHCPLSHTLSTLLAQVRYKFHSASVSI